MRLLLVGLVASAVGWTVDIRDFLPEQLRSGLPRSKRQAEQEWDYKNNAVCQCSTNPPPPVMRHILFVIDSSTCVDRYLPYVQDAVKDTVVKISELGGTSFQYSFMIFSSSVFYVTTHGTVTIDDSRNTQIVYSAGDIVSGGSMSIQNHIRYLGEGVNMDKAIMEARNHFRNHSQDNEQPAVVMISNGRYSDISDPAEPHQFLQDFDTWFVSLTHCDEVHREDPSRDCPNLRATQDFSSTRRAVDLFVYPPDPSDRRLQELAKEVIEESQVVGNDDLCHDVTYNCNCDAAAFECKQDNDITGEPGEDGRPGPAGPPGQHGRDGSPGSPGNPGPAGDGGSGGAKGQPGVDGSDGSDGRTGDPGPRGSPGRQGALGEPGDGAKTKTGVRGPPGPPGPSGQRGDEGPDGPNGGPGDQGDNGANGEPGMPGADGRHGGSGRPGVPGRNCNGDNGPPGPQGADGFPGMPGLDGTPGTPGNDGQHGRCGQQGQKGTPGLTGQQGDNGPPGAKGRRGQDGSNGSQGPQGPAGAQGPPGVDGTNGGDGEAGIQGSTTHGRDGLPGPAGTPGQPGHDGEPGDDGCPGGDGDTGFAGQRGKSGRDGNTGRTGQKGEAGMPGLRGPYGRPGTNKRADMAVLERLVKNFGQRLLDQNHDHSL